MRVVVKRRVGIIVERTLRCNFIVVEQAARAELLKVAQKGLGSVTQLRSELQLQVGQSVVGRVQCMRVS